MYYTHAEYEPHQWKIPVIYKSFDNLEKPSKGCQFSNPLMVMCLTIMSIQNLKQTLNITFETTN